MVMAPIGTVYSYPNNPRVAKALIAARYNGVELTQAKDFEIGTSNRTAEFLAKFPLGKVPALDTPQGPIYESNAIAYYVAAHKDGSQLLGANKYEAALVQQFVAVADNEIMPAAATWLYPLMGYVPYNKANAQKAQEDLKKFLTAFNKVLETRTFLVGERVTLADITVVCTMLNLYKMVMDPAFRKPYVNVNRWFVTCVNQPEFKAVLGDVHLCEKMQEYDAKKFEQKAEKVAEKPAKAASPAKTAADLEDEIEAEEKAASKAKNPLDLLPPSTFVADEWKRFYSNNETRPDAVNWFWQHFDASGWSMWRVDYKYNDELDKVFMSSNLIGGFFQRLERVRKYAFGSMGVYGKDKDNIISGMFIFRGHEIPAEVREVADFESFNFVRVDVADKSVHELWNGYIAWDNEVQGKKFADGKIYK